jgi:hypothetical protein
MKNLKPVVISCMLFVGMNPVQAQIGQLKSASSSISSKKPAKNKTADTETKPETKTTTESSDQKPAENKTADASNTTTPETKPETKTATESDNKPADTPKTVTPPVINETKPVKQDPPLGKYSAIKATMTNASLEKQAIDAVNQKATRENWNERYTKAKIVSQWEVVKNKSTGAILHRKITMVLYGVWPDGKCKAVDFGFFQDYEGNGKYSSLRYNSIGDMTEVQCE